MLTNWLSEKLNIPKVSLIIVWYVCLSLIISFISYYVLIVSIGSVMNKVVSLSPLYSEKMQGVADEFQDYLIENKVSILDKKSVFEWNEEQSRYWIYIFDNESVYFNSQDYWSDINEYEVLDNAQTYSIHFADQSASLIIHPFVNYQLLYGVKSLCFVASSFIFLLMFLVFLHRKIAYILCISECVERMKHGDLSHQIPKIGDHEIASLAMNLNEMASLLDEQIQTEKLLKQEQTEMIASLSHDLRTPLTAVISYLEFIEQKQYESEDKREEYIHIVHQKAIQIKQLIDHLFEQVTEPEKSKVISKGIFDGDLLIENTLNEMRHSLEYEGFMIEMDVKLGHPFEILMELHDFYRLIDNCQSNLLKYADDSKVIQFKVKQSENQLSLSFSNGIRQEAKSQVESHGIGLKNCEQILLDYDGNLQKNQDDDRFELVFILPILQNS